MDLVTFLRARLDEDEARTRDEPMDQWHTIECGYDICEYGYDCSCAVPARVLREVETKRRIVERYADDSFPPEIFDIAAVYADHPDYDPDWKP
jgi:uncharacterized protein DUF6221